MLFVELGLYRGIAHLLLQNRLVSEGGKVYEIIGHVSEWRHRAMSLVHLISDANAYLFPAMKVFVFIYFVQ